MHARKIETIVRRERLARAIHERAVDIYLRVGPAAKPAHRTFFISIPESEGMFREAVTSLTGASDVALLTVHGKSGSDPMTITETVVQRGRRNVALRTEYTAEPERFSWSIGRFSGNVTPRQPYVDLISTGYGALDIRTSLIGLIIIVLGMQTFFGSFYLSILGLQND